MVTAPSVYLLGIDCGLSTHKVSLYDSAGTEVVTLSGPANILRPSPGYVECDMEASWTVISNLIGKVLNRAAVPGDRVIGICCTGHGNGLYLLDEKMRPLQPGITSLDGRCEKILRRWREEDLVSKTRPINGQGFWNGQTLPLLHWQLEERPEILRKSRALVCFKDYIKFKLTGEVSTDYSEISKVGLLDLSKRAYSEPLLALMGIEEIFDALPRLTESTDACGYVHRTAADETGLHKGTPVIGGLADIDACALGAGTIQPDQMCIVTGTWSINEALMDRLVYANDIFGISLYPISGLYLLLEASPTSAANLSWFIDNVLPQAKEKCEGEGSSIYEFCDRLVRSCPPGEDAPVFHPFLYGSHQKTEASAGFLGIKGWMRQEHLLKALYEGIAFAHRVHIDRLRSAGVRADTARLAGGLAKSDVWIQLSSDIFDMKVELTGDKELGTKGCMICASVGCGLYQDVAEAVESTVKTTKIFEPQQSEREYYEKKYLRFKATVEKAEPLWSIVS